LLEFSPIVITVYDRHSHFIRCLTSLRTCTGSEKTPVYIGIDHPRTPEVENRQNQIIDFLKDFKGFKYIRIIRHGKNLGPRGNAKAVISLVLKSYDSFIRSEDDNVFHKSFLEVINEQLILNQPDKRIFAICGYSYPTAQCELKEHSNRFAKVSEFYPWGYGTWKDRHESFQLNYYDVFRYLIKPKAFAKFLDNCHFKAVKGLIVGYCRRHYYTDYMYSAYTNIHDLFCLIPQYSLVRNIGQDESGVNSGRVDSMMNQILFNGKGQTLLDDSFNCSDRHKINRNQYFDTEFGWKSVDSKILLYPIIVVLYILDFFIRFKPK